MSQLDRSVFGLGVDHLALMYAPTSTTGSAQFTHKRKISTQRHCEEQGASRRNQTRPKRHTSRKQFPCDLNTSCFCFG
ncbi:hypothetical protein RSAG8_05366, partial [Rhizoctonia solani AG-8 WAC10335]